MSTNKKGVFAPPGPVVRMTDSHKTDSNAAHRMQMRSVVPGLLIANQLLFTDSVWGLKDE